MFKPGMSVKWRDGRADATYGMRRMFGDGPFTVTAVMDVEAKDRQAVGCDQYVQLDCTKDLPFWDGGFISGAHLALVQ